MDSLRPVLLLLLFSVAASGCRACSSCGNVAKSIRETAPEDAVKKQARKELETSPAKLSTICGVDVSGLKDMVVTVVKFAVREVGIETLTHVQEKVLAGAGVPLRTLQMTESP